MFLILIEGDTYQTQKIDSSYQYKGIRIEKIKNIYYLKLDKDYLFSDNSKIKKLEEKEYIIQNEKNFYSIYLYCYGNNEGYHQFHLYKKDNFIYSSNEKSNIINLDKNTKDKYFCFEDNRIKSNGICFLNNNPYHDEELKVGDCIRFYGFIVYFFKDFIYCNEFKVKNKLTIYQPVFRKIIYLNKEYKKHIFIKTPIEELTIDPIDEIELPKKPSYSSNISNSIVMFSSTSLMAGISFYNSLLNEQPFITRISFLIMPLGLFASGILLPLIRNLSRKKKYEKEYKQAVQDYLSYLDTYLSNQKEKINKHIELLNQNYFSVVNNEKLFSIGSNDSDFLTLSIGKTKINKDIVTKKTKIDEIDQKMEQIHAYLSQIDDVPYFLDIKKYSWIHIVCSKEEKQYYLYKFLLEIIAKNSYEDFNIGIYSKKKEVYDSFYNLPMLFTKGKRNTFENEKELEEFAQSNVDKPFLLFLYDSVSVDIENLNVHIIAFYEYNDDIDKLKGPLIEFHHSTGFLYENGKKEFHFNIELFEFNKYFSYFGKLLNFRSKDDHLGFKDYYSLESIENNYENPNGLLQADFAIRNGELFSIDLDDSKQGPHGLIGGSTGSGKSELIVSLLLSLCLRYPPSYLNLVIIDYKGGGLANSLSYKGKQLPHIIANLSNLEDNRLERLIIALNNECLLRQKKFKELSISLRKSIVDIKDYQEEAKDLASILIVVDEFAQLKKEHPDQIKDLISISRIGRSLGIHLILATQKPSGVIDEEIWSNSKFKIALKVNEEKDSVDIIKTKDAAFLNNPGEFYLRVNDSLLKAKSFYSKRDIHGKDDYRVELLSNTLQVQDRISYRSKDMLSECEYFCGLIQQICDKNHYVAFNLNYEAPTIKKRIDYFKENYFFLGESDDYINNRNELLYYSIKESFLIYSNRKKEMNSFINTLFDNKRDFVLIGTIQSNRFQTISYDSNEDILYVLKKILLENFTLIIEDLTVFLSYNDSYGDLLLKITKKLETKDSNMIAFSHNSNLPYRLVNAFQNRFIIEEKEKSIQMEFFNSKSSLEGSSFYYKEEVVPFVATQLEELEDSYKVKDIVPIIPEQFSFEVSNDHFLIGYDLLTRRKLFVDSKMTLISMNQDLLNAYQKAYPALKCKLYHRKMINEGLQEGIWLGSGIFNQSLFLSGLKQDLQENEGLYIKGNQMRKLRIIDE